MDKTLEIMKLRNVDKIVQVVVLDDPEIDAEQVRAALNEAKVVTGG